MSMILVTGVNGFVGQHLVLELRAQNFVVLGVGREPTASSNIQGLLEQYTVCDLTKPEDVKKLPLKEVDGIINLAGFAAVGNSFDEPELYMKVNVGVLSVMCQEIFAQKLERQIRVLAISTGAVYASDQTMPLTEDSRTDPKSSPYVASKLAMEEVAEDYRQQGLDCIVTRPLNHIGPGQGPGFLLPDLYVKCLDAINSGQPLRVGNLTTKRDYTDVRDVAKAYAALISADSLRHAAYNVCSGASHSGTEVLETLKSALGHPELITVVDEALFRPSDATDLYGSNNRLKQETGWSPSIPFETTIQDFVAWENSL